MIAIFVRISRRLWFKLARCSQPMPFSYPDLYAWRRKSPPKLFLPTPSGSSVIRLARRRRHWKERKEVRARPNSSANTRLRKNAPFMPHWREFRLRDPFLPMAVSAMPVLQLFLVLAHLMFEFFDQKIDRSEQFAILRGDEIVLVLGGDPQIQRWAHRDAPSRSSIPCP